ncbi:MAG: hypothetical protein AB8G11_26410 [Saprospiraceae bacterium]
MKTVFQFISVVIVITLIAYGIISIFDVEVKNLMDWIVGISTFLWLVVITVVPWNAHFRAKEVLDDAEISQRKNILVIESSLEYAQKVAVQALYVAICLHVVSAIGLYLIAKLGVSSVGYFGAVAAILLTFFRPIVAFYEYLQKRLADIRQEFRYPREDVRELLNTFNKIKEQIKDLEDTLETNPKIPSWRQEVNYKNIELKAELDKFNRFFHEYKKSTDLEFVEVRKESKLQVEKLAADSQILESVRVLAKFAKEVKW